MPAAWRDGIIALALAAVTLLLYARVAHFDAITFDDPTYVTANPQVQAGITLKNIVWAFTTGAAGNWHPITWLSHMLDVTMFGTDYGLHHLTNIMIHCANVVLLYLVLSKASGAAWSSAAVAALFAVHPLHVESVAWLAERKDVLSACFFLLAILAYLRYALLRTIARYLLVVLAF
jgi:hypothetical protein